MTCISSICHALGGVVSALALSLPNGWVVAPTYAWVFVKYQRIEQKQIKDKAYPELAEYMIGFGGTLIFLLIK